MPEGHRFPIQKYEMLRHLLEEDVKAGESFVFIEPHAANDDELRRVHCLQYLGRVFGGTLTKAEIQRIGFPWSENLIERSLRSTGAAVDAGVSALRYGTAASLAGGTHSIYANPDRMGQSNGINNQSQIGYSIQSSSCFQRVVFFTYRKD